MTAYPKHQYIRSKALLRAVAGLECQACGRWPTQAAHANWGGGKGKGIKADDSMTAALCLACHWEIDQGHKLSKDERIEMWTQAHKKTVAALQAKGLWPDDVPVPQLPSSCL